jgi:hypothetical protein
MALNKELIVKALQTAGLDEGLIDQITAESEEELATQISELKKKLEKPSLASLLKEAGLDENLEEQIKATVGKLIESETDRRVKQYVANNKKQKKGGDDDEEDPQIAALNEKIDKLTEALTGQQKQQEQNRLKTISGQKLKEKGLPESWLGRISVEKEDQIDSVIASLEKEHNEIQQRAVDKILSENPIPGYSFGQNSEAGIKARIDKYIETTTGEQKGARVQKIGITDD